MPVQFISESSNTISTSQRASAVSNPEQVRRKWDALLNVINNDGPVLVSQGQDTSQRPPFAVAAKDMVSESVSPSKTSPQKSGRRREWDDRHHLLYSVVNARMQRNIRSYFGRPRDIDSYGLRYDDPLRTIWQLDTEEEKPPLDTLRGHYAKFNGHLDSNGKLLSTFHDQQHAALNSQSVRSPMASTGMSRSNSDPSVLKIKEGQWNWRHQVTFAKDNHHYHANTREYFERPRAILW
jgi:hypothetical protein